ncbi:MAG: N-acetylneuraminate synthase [Dehalococcoidales bacterium]|jgi:N-acetylneuraminate synthase/N,N'-diacetyllegionaminate synthase|nr:N-acetylneuraminate synthase [Dehalococcoidales bacterium]
MKIKIADNMIGEGEPCFIIAEAGVNHNGDIDLARKLVDAAREAGADAVKFQTFKAETIVTRSAEKAGYQKETTPSEESQYDMIKKLELAGEDFKSLFAYAQEKGVLFLSSPFDKGSVDLLSELGVSALKIPSGEITNFPLLKHIAKKGKPIILSTGMATHEEVGETLEVIKEQGIDDIILLHCVTSYPAKIGDMNLKAMETLRNAFQLPVGLSDHSIGTIIPVAAVALGACVIEKHFTLDKNLPGPDHRASLEPDELKQMITAIRDVEKAMGNGIKRPTKVEEENKKVVRRSLVAKVDIPQGTTITGEMLAIKRPGTGLEPKYLGEIIGRTAEGTIKKDEIIAISKLRSK